MLIDIATPVLIADDSQMTLQIVETMLQRIGFTNITAVSSGGAAWDILWRKHVGLVISDWNMAPVNGIELLSRMRGNQRYAETPFLMISTNAMQGRVLAARHWGAFNFLVKPFNFGTLEKNVFESLL